MTYDHLIKFEVEERDQDTGYWRTLLPIIPHYRVEKQAETKRFLWFTWKKTSRLIVNRRGAYLNARKRALLQGRAYYRRGRRVRIRAYMLDPQGFEYTSTIWEGGKFLDC